MVKMGKGCIYIREASLIEGGERKIVLTKFLNTKALRTEDILVKRSSESFLLR